MGKKVKLDMSAKEKELIKKTIKDPYWGTGGSKGGFNVNTMTPQALNKLSKKQLLAYAKRKAKSTTT